MLKARKLLFVAALTTPTAAFADSRADEARASAVAADREAAEAAARGHVIYALLDGTPYRIEPDKAPVAASREAFGAFLGMTQPLTGPDGRPACGNVLSKAQDPCAEARDEAVTKRLAAIETKVKAAVAKAGKGRR